MTSLTAHASTFVRTAIRAPASRMVLASAMYGMSVGFVHSPRFALLNLAKFPLLLSVSIALCAASHFLAARFLGARLRFRDVLRSVVDSYRHTSVLLASLAPVCLVFALTLEAPRSTTELREYPWFVGANVVLIAATGAMALVQQARTLLGEYGLTPRRTIALMTTWLALSLLVGGQFAWYLRPFFGNRAVPDDGAFCLGARPDFRGDRSFYEAVYHLVRTP